MNFRNVQGRRTCVKAFWTFLFSLTLPVFKNLTAHLVLFSVFLGTVLLNKLDSCSAVIALRNLFLAVLSVMLFSSSERRIEQRILAQALGVTNLNKFTEEKRETLRNV